MSTLPLGHLRLANPLRRRSSNTYGDILFSPFVGWKVLSCISFAAINGLTKTLCLSPFQLVFLQNLTAGLILAGCAGVHRHHFSLLAQPAFWMRAVFAFLGTALWVYALQKTSLLTCVAAGLLGPFMTSFCAWLIFGERLTGGRILAILLATLGGLLILHPDLPLALYNSLKGQPCPLWGTMDSWTLLPLASTLCFVGSNLCAKQLLSQHNPLVVTGWQMLACAALASLTTLPWALQLAQHWAPQSCSGLMAWKGLAALTTPKVAVKLAALVGLTATAHLSLNSAIKLADLTLLLPIGGLRLLANLGLAWYLFHEVPKLPSVFGIALIMLALALLFHKEARQP